MDRLDPGSIRDQLLAYGEMPGCAAGRRHTPVTPAASGATAIWPRSGWKTDWVIEVHEVGFPNLDRFAYFRNLGILMPNYRTSALALPKKRRL